MTIGIRLRTMRAMVAPRSTLPYPDIMDISTMCQALRISEKTGYKLIKSGQITAMKVGRAYRIPKMHVLSYLKLTNAA